MNLTERGQETRLPTRLMAQKMRSRNRADCAHNRLLSGCMTGYTVGLCDCLLRRGRNKKVLRVQNPSSFSFTADPRPIALHKSGSCMRPRTHPALGHDVDASSCSSKGFTPFLSPCALSSVLTKYQETKDKKAEAPEPEEPQNPLTNKFTEGEWKALKELRVSC